MKASLVLPAAVSVAVIGVAVSLGIGRLTRESGAGVAADLARFEERLAAMEGRLADISGIRAELDRLAARQPGPVALPPAPEAAVTRAAAGGEETARPAVPDAGDAPGKLETWLSEQGMRDEFEGLVSRVYEQARDRRRLREKEEADLRAQEMMALAEGPYGKHNYRINSLAKKLDLDGRQKDYLFSILEKYDDRRRTAMESANQLDPAERSPEKMKERMELAMRTHQQLNQECEEEILLGLSPDQQQLYRDLPEHERGGSAWQDVKVVSYDGFAGRIVAPAGLPVEMEVRQALREAIKSPPPEKAQPEGE